MPTTHALTLAATSGNATTLFVLLHGVGADAASFHDIARALAPAFPHADFVTPDGFQPFDQASSGRQWFSITGVTPENRGARVREAGQTVSTWVDHELDTRGLARDRVVFVGFSQGSIVSAWLAMHRTPSPAAVVMFSGRVPGDPPPVAHAVTTPVFMAHGTNDPRIPIAELATGAKVLEAWGAQVTTQTYPGLGHSIDRREIEDAIAFLQGTSAANGS